MPSHISPCRLQMPGRLPLQCTSAVHRDFLMSSRTWQTRTDQQIHDNPIDAHHGWGSPGRQAAFSPRPCHGHYLLPSGCHGSQPSMWQTMPRHEKDAWNRCKSHETICFQDMLQRHCRWLGVQSRSRCLLLDCCSGCLQGSGFVTLVVSDVVGCCGWGLLADQSCNATCRQRSCRQLQRRPSRDMQRIFFYVLEKQEI